RKLSHPPESADSRRRKGSISSSAFPRRSCRSSTVQKAANWLRDAWSRARSCPVRPSPATRRWSRSRSAASWRLGVREGRMSMSCS
ncbi:hypothetical protein HEAFMP_HEAFMP_12470, partial [Dysosmobacter welbionis]